MMAQQQQQQQQQYFQYTAQPGAFSPGATVYTYPGAQQPQTMITQPGAASVTTLQNRFDLSGSRTAVVLAIVHLVIGCCCIGCQSTSIYLESSLSQIYTSESRGTGIWCGISFIVTGALGLSACKRNSPILIGTFLAMNVLSSIASWFMLAFARANMELVQECQREGVYTSFLSSVRRTCTDILYAVWIAMDALMIALAVVEFITAVTSAIYSGRAMYNCCGSYQQRSGVQVATTVQLPSQQQQQYQAVESKPNPEQESGYTQYPATYGAAPTVSYGQPSHAQSAQPPYYQHQQQVPLLAVNPQNAYGPFAATSETAIREAAAPSGAVYPGTQAYCPPAAGYGNAVPTAPELPPSYDAAMKL